jgi:phosphoribosylformimino-5-aminoimidazole carboxamide ribotide isomerase
MDKKACAFLQFPKRYPHVRFQFGGGLRSREAVAEVLALGFDAVVGTLAVESPETLRGLTATTGPQIIAALDLRGARVQLRGWTQSAQSSGESIAAALLSVGVREALVTDVDRDGMLQGPGISALTTASAWGFVLQASGGVARIEDLDALSVLPSVRSAISGKALLDGHIDLSDPHVRAALAGEP